MKLLLGILLAVVAVSNGENPSVSTPLGDVIGSTFVSRLNRTIYAFRGIRYAKAPIGELRFKPPVPVEKWSGVYNATVDGPVCPQPSDDPVSEDCLVLNVYTTKLCDCNTDPKRPVIIYIHAGGFYSVTGRSDWAGPQYFLDQDIVLVTINYRLASLGFLSTGKDAPGNNGLKDQVMAMKWVRDNIEPFGGDPNSVTLYGYSAGAWSISLHLVSPMSRGLFHRAILGSGSALGQFKLPHDQVDLAKKQASLVGCDDGVEVTVMLDCLKAVPAVVLGNSLGGFDEFGYDPIIVWYPTIEEDFGQERFLPEDPVKMIQRGDFAQVPIVAGITQIEFGYRAFEILLNKTYFDQFSTDFYTNAPIAFLYERKTAKSKNITSAIRKFYFNDQPFSNASFSGIEEVYADSVIGFPVNRFVNLIAEKSSQRVYYYQFTYQGRFSHFYLPGSNDTKPYGAVHHDDLIYLFYISPIFPFFNESYPEREMVGILTSLWATFAQTGKPVPEASPINWEPYNVAGKYLEIGNEIVLKEKLYQERYEFWDKLFPIN